MLFYLTRNAPVNCYTLGITKCLGLGIPFAKFYIGSCSVHKIWLHVFKSETKLLMSTQWRVNFWCEFVSDILFADVLVGKVNKTVYCFKDTGSLSETKMFRLCFSLILNLPFRISNHRSLNVILKST